MNEPQAGGPTSLTLLDRLRGEAPDAWRRFSDLYGPLVYCWCRKAGLQADDAADVCQEVFASVARGIGSFRHAGPAGAFRGWLRAITRNSLNLHFRRRGQHPQATGGTDARQLLEETPDLEMDDPDEAAAETAALVRAPALELIRPDLSEQTWQAFCRVALDGASPAEVGTQLGMSVFAVRQANFRVRRRLREELSDLFP